MLQGCCASAKYQTAERFLKYWFLADCRIREISNNSKAVLTRGCHIITERGTN